MRGRLAGARVDERLLGGELAGEDAEEAQVADELVVERLEDLADELARLGRLERDLLGLVAAALDGRALLALQPATGRSVHRASSSSATPMSFLAEVQKIGMTVPAASALGRAACQLLGGDVALGQVLLHQRLVGLDDGVDELGAGRRPGRPGSRRGLGRRVEDADDAAEARADGRSGR